MPTFLQVYISWKRKTNDFIKTNALPKPFEEVRQENF